MITFRDIIKQQITESAVGKVGRTKDSEALEHIENSDVAKRFRKIVKELGGKNVARQLLSGMTPSGNKVSVPTAKTLVQEQEETIEQFLRNKGFKIKAENPKIRKKEIVFFNSTDTEAAYSELIQNGYDDKYDIEHNVSKKNITYI